MASIINAATSGGLVTTADTSGILQLQTAGTTAVTVDAAGGVKTLNTISVGNATPSTSGAGITFPASMSDSTDSNTLDDYEEGTWTPNQGSGLVVVGTFSSTGWYTKIGRIVQVTGTVTGSSSISVSSNSLITSNMPFNVIAGASPCGSMVNGSTQLGGLTQGGASSGQLYAATTIPATANIFFSLTYNV